MLADDHIERRTAVHGLFHHLVVGDIAAVVREKCRTGLGQSLEICDFLAEASPRNARRRKNDASNLIPDP